MKPREIDFNKKLLQQATGVVKTSMQNAAKINEISLLINQPEYREELLAFAHTIWDEAATLIVTLEAIQAKINAAEVAQTPALSPLSQKEN